MTGPAKIFVVDDDADVRESLCQLLDAAGFESQAYESAQAFLAGARMPEGGCLIVDLRMPGMNGLELQQKLVADGVQLPVIIVTGHADVPLAVQAMKAGARDFIEKPYSHATILNAVNAALGSANAAPGSAAIPDQIGRRLAQLTARERDVLEQLVVGHPNKVIALNLQISPRTVEIHRARVMDKMAASSLSHLVRMALAAGIGPKTP
jgi:two-component system response regulator FixJ